MLMTPTLQTVPISAQGGHDGAGIVMAAVAFALFSVLTVICFKIASNPKAHRDRMGRWSGVDYDAITVDVTRRNRLEGINATVAGVVSLVMAGLFGVLLVTLVVSYKTPAQREAERVEQQRVEVHLQREIDDEMRRRDEQMMRDIFGPGGGPVGQPKTQINADGTTDSTHSH
ncbi:MAG: hypothetical protein GC164_02075 [Phycisphaera sp.]|nr:hypothetical protein [Phycisphaera sp.]